jgi:metallo-beta-lactamase family protein
MRYDLFFWNCEIDEAMRLRFLGANDGHVTGSCTHFFYDRKKTHFLVDCGLVQGEGNDRVDNSRPFAFSPSEISFVLLTHAHQDHCGLIPRLYKEGFSGKVICTRATARLASASLMDSVRHVNGLFSEEDVKQVRFECIDEREGFGLSRMLPIHNDLFASFTRSAHILGATSITIGWLNNQEKMVSMVMSGDLGNNTKENPYQPLLAGRQRIFGNPEAIVVESTYGGRAREKKFSDFDGRLAALREMVQTEVFDKKALLIIPAFSLQRTQEVLFDLRQVFKNHFYSEAQSQSPVAPKNPHYDYLQHDKWNWQVQQEVERAIAAMPEKEQGKWTSSIIQEKADGGSQAFRLRDNSDISIADVKELVSDLRHTYPVDIVLDSPLAREIGAVFGDELCRRQRKSPNETVYRNRLMAERLGVSLEEQVDEIIRSLFPPNDVDEKVVPLGIHSIRYQSKFKTPRAHALHGRGCILITGGGMCEGGPVVQHLEKIVATKQQASILVTGYMAKGSLGDSLLAIGKARLDGLPLSPEKILIGAQSVLPTDFRAKVIQAQGYYSGHADQDGLLDFVFGVTGKSEAGRTHPPVTVFLNHGQHAARRFLKEAIEARKQSPMLGDREIADIELPDDSGRWYDLNAKTWLDPELESKTDRLIKELLLEQRKTNMLLQQLVEKRSPPFGFQGKPKPQLK